MAEELEYKSAFDGEQIDRAIGVIINGDIDGDVERAESAATAAEQAADIASAAAQDAETAAVRTPYVGENGNWFAWDNATDSYKDSGVPAQGESGVYLGSTEPTDEEIKVWVDPDGEPSDLELLATNLIANGDFSAGTAGWALTGAALSNEVLWNGLQTVKCAPVSQTVYALKNLASINPTHKCYISISCYISSIDGTLAIIDARNISDNSNISLGYADVSKLNMWQRVSTIVTGKIGGVRLYFGNANFLRTGVYYFSGALCIDLTARFGAGNEPTAAEMDAIVSYYPNSWFDGTVNLAQSSKMLPYLLSAIRAKADKAQEAWITPTLLNGWVNTDSATFDTCQFLKDSIGFVSIKGLIKSGTVGYTTPVFVLPAGYRPSKEIYFATACNNAYGTIVIRPNGNVYIGNGSDVWSSLNCRFRAEA